MNTCSTINIQKELNEEYWPIKPNGEIPKDLFTEDHLYKVFFELLPIVLNISITDIRQGIKNHLKKLGWSAKYFKDQKERDSSMIWDLVSSPSARSKLQDLEILPDSSTRRNGGTLRRKAFRPKQDFPHLVWLSYLKDRNLDPITIWLTNISEKEMGIGERKFIKAKNLLDGLANDDCPVHINSIELARPLLLFASLNTKNECIELITAAIDSGCTILEQYIKQKPEDTNSSPKEISIENKSTFTQPPPKLTAITYPTPQNEIETPYQVKKFITSLQKTESEYLTAKETASDLHKADITTLLEGSEERWQQYIETNNLARERYVALRSTREKLQELEQDFWESVFYSLGLDIEQWKYTTNHTEDSLSSIAKISTTLEKTTPPQNLFYKWLKNSKPTEEQITIKKLEDFLTYCEKENRRKASWLNFRTELVEYSGNVTHLELSNLISSWCSDSLGAILDDFLDEKWVVGGAIIFRASLDASKGDAPAFLEEALLEDKNRLLCRDLIRFTSSSSIERFSIPAQRIFALERLRDILQNGPLAQISNPTLRLLDVELVGRSICDIHELISTNLSVFSSGKDIASALKAISNDNSELEHLKEFIYKPATMKGNFRRLREMAREKSLLPLIVDGEINQTSARALLRSINSGKISDEIFSELKDLRPEDPLEQRHKDQLDRYLYQAAELIQAISNKEKSNPSNRIGNLASDMKRLLGKLREDGKPGTLSWMESEVSKLLKGESKIPKGSASILLGGNERILSQVWTREDTEWASPQLMIPNYYTSEANSYANILASIITYRYGKTIPTSLEVLEDLIDHKRFPEAYRFIEEAKQDTLLSYFLATVEPTSLALKERSELLKIKYGERLIREIEESRQLEQALALHDYNQASELIDFIESLAAELSSSGRGEALIKEKEEKERIKKFISIAGFDVDPEESLEQLELTWLEILESHTPSREHLIFTDSAFLSVDQFIPEITHKFSQFKDLSLQATYWLPEDISRDFRDLLQDTTSIFIEWSKNCRHFIHEERTATLRLCMSHLDFVLDLSKDLNSLREEKEKSDAMLMLLELSSICQEASGPSNCLAQLVEAKIFNLADLDGEEKPEKNTLPNKKTTIQSAQATFPAFRDTSQELRELIKEGNWQSIAKVASETLSHLINTEEEEGALSLIKIAEVFQSLEEEVPVKAIDDLASAAAWLTQAQMATTLLDEKHRLDLGYSVLARALSLEASISVEKNTGGGWSDLLPALRKILTPNLSTTVGRVLEHLTAGSIGPQVSEKLWDAATNSGESQIQYRTSLLLFLYDHGCLESLSRLANRHEVKISSKLSQFFELRAVAYNRPDLIPVVQSVADQIWGEAKGTPFKNFIKSLPAAVQAVKPNLRISISDVIRLRDTRKGSTPVDLTITIVPEGLVPVKIEATLLPEDDISFKDGNRKVELSNRPIYFASEMTLSLRFGPSWHGVKNKKREGIRIRVRAKTVTGELFLVDEVCNVHTNEANSIEVSPLSNDTLLDSYPGVSNTPAIDKTFIGRSDELEILNQVLVSARRPSPVLLTGMRRVGKTSLLFAFHQRFKQPGNSTSVTFYLSLAERRVELVATERTVAATFFRAISHGLVRPHLTTTDQNHPLCAKIRAKFDGDWKEARKAIESCYDEESLSDSLIALSAKISEWVGVSMERFLLLVDEAEALVAPYQAGGVKKLELEQLLQSLREVSQSTGDAGVLLSGSNHINIFAREYKNAFFGSSQIIELVGLRDVQEASALIAPTMIAPYVQFEKNAIEYAFSLSAGMPQFLWQLGAATAHLVRSGPATRADVRTAVATLVGDGKVSLPFKSYEILEPIDSLLSLEGPRERDLLWMLLYRVADASSLIVEDAAIPFVIDASLLAIDDRTAWNKRLRTLIDLKILRMDSPTSVRFQVPLFAEGFRTPKNWQEFNIRLQQVSG